MTLKEFENICYRLIDTNQYNELKNHIELARNTGIKIQGRLQFELFIWTIWSVEKRKASLKIFDTLVESGLDINVRDGIFGNTVLMSAIEIMNFDNIRYLIEKGARVNIFNSTGETPFMIACEQHNKDVLNLLIENGADINTLDDDGFDCLSYAVCNRNNNAIKYLLKKNVNVFHKNCHEESAIDIAKKFQYEDIVKIFNRYIKKISKENKSGKKQ